VSFCESQCFNRFGAVAVKEISARARDPQVTKPLSASLKEKFLWLANSLATMKPRVVDCFADQRPIVLFTDGAAESSDPAVLTFDIVTIGAVAIDTADGSMQHFGDYVPDLIIGEWRAAGILQVITQAEVYPVILAKTLLGKTWQGRRVITFIDNDAARFSFINSNSGSESIGDMLLINSALDIKLNIASWYERVASESNIADLPSRLKFQELEDMGSARVEPDHPDSVKQWKHHLTGLS